ncbi:Ervl/Alr family protein [lymphocystis disease virus-China]|uniref:Sulfhydryl oxidase n=2 Tax=Lymphocystis disease virus 2 TaxID=159183 RepID=A0A6F8X3D9_9VIRU|nr:Ervl/Alr family protein [lymphocystis disease virus-China]AAU10986.1 Ervl/Alr family protein [lymphocystis disease virus-China]BCB67493.1 Ervl/Alr family protein [Lymphocystis disease virus 2]
MNRYLKNRFSSKFVSIGTRPSFNPFAPSEFGPNLWYTLHTAAASASDPLLPCEREEWKAILKGLPALIPCSTCKNHYKEIMIRVDLKKVVHTKKSLFNFLTDLHDTVNSRTNKPRFSREKAKQLYDYDKGPGLMLFIERSTKIFE